MRSSHNTSERFIQTLVDAGIEPNIFANYLNHVLSNCPDPGFTNGKQKFEHGLAVMYTQRVILLCSAA